MFLNLGQLVAEAQRAWTRWKEQHKQRSGTSTMPLTAYLGDLQIPQHDDPSTFGQFLAAHGVPPHELLSVDGQPLLQHLLNLKGEAGAAKAMTAAFSLCGRLGTASDVWLEILRHVQEPN